MKINLITVGRLKENYWRQACGEYLKRLSGFCDVNIIELNEYRLPDKPSRKEILSALKHEGDTMKKYTEKNGVFNIAMCIEGKLISSEDLAQVIADCPLKGFSCINFIIGSSFGIDESIKKSAHMKISMSMMTFPHQLARVILLEQIYRGFQINANTGYHK